MKKYCFIVSAAVLFSLSALGCRQEVPDQKANESAFNVLSIEELQQTALDPVPVETKKPSEESAYLDAFMENAFERDLVLFQKPQPVYEEDDPDKDLKESIDRYLYARNMILSDMHQPFSSMDAVSEMLSCCDPSFQMQAKLTMWYRFYLRKTNEQNHDLSYVYFIHRTCYYDITHEGDEAVVTVQDAIQFQHIDSDVISSSGDTHIIRAKKEAGTWKITDDDPGILEKHISEAYRRFLSDCTFREPDEIENYIKGRYAAWGTKPGPSPAVTEEP